MSLDTLRQQSAQIRYLEQQLHNHMALYGYEYISLPFIEPSDIFLTRAGDKIIDRLFTFDRFGRQLALRPEFTAAAANTYVGSKQTDVVRWQFSGAVFEDEPGDYTLEYQKYSIGAECIGLNGIDADAETIAMAVEGINKLGIKDWQLVIGHVGLQRYLLSRFNLNSRTYRMLLGQREVLKLETQGKTIAFQNMRQILTGDSNLPIDEPSVNQDGENQTQHMLDVLLDSTRYGTTMGGRSRHDIAQRLLHKRERSYEAKQIQNALDFFADWVNLRAPVESAFLQMAAWIGDDAEGQAILQNWRQTIQLLVSYGINLSQIIVQADLTKNWEYYTGIVFGVEAGEDNYIVGGGRYDDLTRVLGSDKYIPAIGFAYYVDALLPLLPQIEISIQPVALNGDNLVEVITWAKFLRDNSVPVVINAKAGVTVNINKNRASWNNTTYSLSEKDQLLKDLRASQS